MPGRVKVAPRKLIAPTVMTRFMSRAMFAIIPL